MITIKATSNKLWLIVGWLMGLLFTIIWLDLLCKWVYYWTRIWPMFYEWIQSWELNRKIVILVIIWVLIFWVLVLIMIGSWLLPLVISIKWFIDLFRKRNVKKNKEWMKRIEAKVVAFEACNPNKETGVASTYYFTVSDWINDYDSEEFNAKVTWWCWNIGKSLELMKISYNSENPKITIRALNERLKTIEIELQEQTWIKATLLRWAYTATQKVKEDLEKWITPYMEFRWHKLSIWDRVGVYVDPENSDNYWVDADFLYH